MSSLVSLFNSAATAIFNILLIPFSVLAPVWGLLALSLISGIILLLIYGRISNQDGLKRVKKRIYGCVLESVLYRHDLKLSLKAQARMFGAAFAYLGVALPPVIILAIPCLIILAQLNLRYGSLAPSAKDQIVLEARLKSGELLKEVRAVPSDGLEVTPPVRVMEDPAIFWRLRRASSDSALTLHAQGAASLSVTLGPGSPAKPRPAIYAASPWTALLYPGAPVLSKDSPFSEISLKYPEAHYKILGLKMHWLLVFLVFSILSGLIAAKLFKVEI